MPDDFDESVRRSGMEIPGKEAASLCGFTKFTLIIKQKYYTQKNSLYNPFVLKIKKPRNGAISKTLILSAARLCRHTFLPLSYYSFCKKRKNINNFPIVFMDNKEILFNKRTA